MRQKSRPFRGKSGEFFGAACLIVVLLVSGAVGCGRQEELTEVHGIVRIAGAPAANVLVSYLAEGPARPHASAVTDDNGRYELRSADGRAGAARGRYRITLEDLNLYNIERTDRPPTKENAPPASRVAIPFRAATTTPLECVVGAESQEMNLDLPAARP